MKQTLARKKPFVPVQELFRSVIPTRFSRGTHFFE